MSLNHLLHVTSASLNLAIISITGSQFRKTLLLVLNCTKRDEIKSKLNGNMKNRVPANNLSNKPPEKENVKETFEMRRVTLNATYVKHTEISSVQTA